MAPENGNSQFPVFPLTGKFIQGLENFKWPGRAQSLNTPVRHQKFHQILQKNFKHVTFFLSQFSDIFNLN